MCAKNRVDIFSSFLDIRQNAEWPHFFWPTLYFDFFEKLKEQNDSMAILWHCKLM